MFFSVCLVRSFVLYRLYSPLFTFVVLQPLLSVILSSSNNSVYAFGDTSESINLQDEDSDEQGFDVQEWVCVSVTNTQLLKAVMHGNGHMTNKLFYWHANNHPTLPSTSGSHPKWQISTIDDQNWKKEIQKSDTEIKSHSPISSSITDFAHCTLTQWTNAQICLQTIMERMMNNSYEHWIKPKCGTVKVNVDDTVFSDQEKYDIGGVDKVQNGYVLESFQEPRNGIITLEVADILALKETLRWIKEMNWQSLEMNNILLSHVKRSANYVSHMLAHTIVNIPDCNLYWDHLPKAVVAYVAADNI